MSYSQIQSVFLMNMAVNGASDIFDTQSNLQQFLQVYLNGGQNPDKFQYPGFFPLLNSATPNADYPGGQMQQLWGAPWTVVWGPCILGAFPESFAVNAMFVAYSATENTFVVAVAATNPTSFYDWMFEDADVDPHCALAWPPTLPVSAPIPKKNPPGGAAISHATALGISNLLTTGAMSATGTPPNVANAPAVTGNVQAFLAACQDPTATLIFTGHSLAGALSPTLALYLYPTGNTDGSGTQIWKNVYVLPTAGATPGNPAFAALFEAAYPQTAADDPVLDWNPQWNTDTKNGQDVVPHAWNELTNVVQQPTVATSGCYPSIWGYMSSATGSDLYGTVQNAGAIANYQGSCYYSPITELYALAPFIEQPSADFSWTNPPWGYWQWTSAGTDNSYDYPPSWSAMTQFTQAAPIANSSLGSLVEATHVDQYYNLFDVVPTPKMQHHMVNVVCPFCASAKSKSARA